jgi:hypothetical protein
MKQTIIAGFANAWQHSGKFTKKPKTNSAGLKRNGCKLIGIINPYE